VIVEVRPQKSSRLKCILQKKTLHSSRREEMLLFALTSSGPSFSKISISKHYGYNRTEFSDLNNKN
jgi:hypothetical protein